MTMLGRGSHETGSIITTINHSQYGIGENPEHAGGANRKIDMALSWQFDALRQQHEPLALTFLIVVFLT